MKNKNHNIRFNMEKGDECRAWELLHSPQIRQMFKSQNRFVIEAVNDYYDRYVAEKNDPYMETREKADAFALIRLYGGISGGAGRYDVWAGIIKRRRQRKCDRRHSFSRCYESDRYESNDTECREYAGRSCIGERHRAARQRSD